MIVHHLSLRPTLDGSRVIDVTLDLTADQLSAGAHAVGVIVLERYRVAVLEDADAVLAMRELRSLTDELASLALPGAINRLTLSVVGAGRLKGALEDFASSRADGAIRVGDAEALPHVHAMIDGVAEAHAGALRAAADDTADLRR